MSVTHDDIRNADCTDFCTHDGDDLKSGHTVWVDPHLFTWVDEPDFQDWIADCRVCDRRWTGEDPPMKPGTNPIRYCTGCEADGLFE